MESFLFYTESLDCLNIVPPKKFPLPLRYIKTHTIVSTHDCFDN